MQCKYVHVNALFSESQARSVSLRVRAFGGAVEPSMTQEGNPPIFKRLVDEKKREWPGVEGLEGCREDRGQAEEQDSHYHSGLRWLLCPTGSDLLGFFILFFFFLKEPCSLTSLPFAQHSVCYTPVASGEGRSGRGINLGLPHSVLGFQRRRHPLKVSGAGAPAARWGEFYDRSGRISEHLLVLILILTVEPTNPSDE